MDWEGGGGGRGGGGAGGGSLTNLPGQRAGRLWTVPEPTRDCQGGAPATWGYPNSPPVVLGC
eukprot:7932243-Pyramimonas_sp.AAC.1